MRFRALKISAWILIGIAAFLLSLFFVVRSSAFQTWTVNKVLKGATKSVNGELSIGRLHISSLNKITLENVNIVSKDKPADIQKLYEQYNYSDTLCSVEYLSARFSIKDLLSKEISLKELNIRGGFFYLQSEGEYSNIDRIFNSGEKKDTTQNNSTVINLKRLSVSDFRFRLYDPLRKKESDGYFTDFSDLDVKDIYLSASDIRYTPDSVSVTLEKLCGYDKSGFNISNLSGKVCVGDKLSIIKDFNLQDGRTNLQGPYLSMGYSNAKTLKYFTDSVSLGIALKKSTIDFVTLSRLSQGLKDSRLKLLNVNGEVKGTIRDLKAKSLNVSSESGQSVILLKNVLLRGLPDAQNTDIQADIKDITTVGKDLATILSDLNGSSRIAFLDNMSPLEIFHFDGTLSGKLNDLHADLNINSNYDNAHLKANIDRRTTGKTIVGGKLNAEKIDIGRIADVKALGDFKGIAEFNIKAGGNTVIDIKKLEVQKINVNGYDFNNIKAVGTYTDNFFDGKILCGDGNLNMLFHGQATTNLKDGSKFKFYANIPYADLSAINVDKRDSLSELSLSINADLTLSKQDGIIGFAKIGNISYINSTGDYDIGDIDFRSNLSGGKYTIDFLSDFARGRYEGSAELFTFIDKAKALIAERHFSNLMSKGKGSDKKNKGKAKEEHGEPARGNFNLALQTFNTQGIFALLSPGVYLQHGTSIRAKISDDDNYRVTLTSGRIAYKNNYLKNVNLTINNRDSLIYARLFNKDAVFAGVKVDSTRVSVIGADNKVNLTVRFHNDTTGSNNTNIRSTITFPKDTTITIRGMERKLANPINIALRNSDVTLKGATWNFRPASILISDSVIVANGVELYNGKQSLKADGYLSKTIRDSLGISMERFNIAIVDQFLDKPYKIHGLLSGRANLSMNKGNSRMFASFMGDSMYVYDSPLGELMLLGKWSEENNRYSLLARTSKDGETQLNVTGFYRPTDNYLDIQSNLHGLSLTYIEPVLSSVVRNMGGAINGKIHAYGPVDKLVLEGENCSFSDFKFTLDYTNVPYTLNGPIGIDKTGIYFNNDIITDNYGGRGTLTGSVKHQHLQDIKAKIRISLSNLHALNTTEKINEDFYGTAFASGNVTIEGTPDKMEIGVNATTQKKTFVHIPISGASKATKTNILTFKQVEKKIEIDPYDTLFLSKKEKKTPMELAINLNLNATPDANLWLEIDKSTGDIVKAQGRGRIGVNVNPQKGIFDLTGNYTVSNGSYKFVLMGLASRDFEVQEGSAVTFNGPIDNTNLDVTALYKTKASINRLISDTSSVSAMRNVVCSIIAKGRLANPEIKFKIDIPDIDPTTKVKVESALNSEDKIQKQFAALIASGGFIPDAQSGVSSNSTMLYSNATELLSNQLNSIFMQLGIPLDLGLNYQNGDNSKNDAFDVAVSTQLFNNRVIINGNIGNNPYDNDGRDVKGNIDVEVKLDNKGKIRLNLFSHSTDKYSNYLDESQRTGIGIAYQHEFNSFKDLFRKKSARQKEFEKLLKERQKQQRKQERATKKEERRKAKADKETTSNY